MVAIIALVLLPVLGFARLLSDDVEILLLAGGGLCVIFPRSTHALAISCSTISFWSLFLMTT